MAASLAGPPVIPSVLTMRPNVIRLRLRRLAARSPVRSRRLGVVACLVIVIGVLAVSLAMASRSHDNTKAAVSVLSQYRSTLAVVEGIPEHGSVLGHTSAPVTIEYFDDLASRKSRHFVLQSLPWAILRWVRSGKANLRYRGLDATSQDRAQFLLQQRAAYAAGLQERLWYFVMLSYFEQVSTRSNQAMRNYTRGLAAQVPGLRIARWARDSWSPAIAKPIAVDGRVARERSVTEGPAIFVGRAGGEMRKLPRASLDDPSRLNRAIEQAAGSSK